MGLFTVVVWALKMKPFLTLGITLFQGAKVASFVDAMTLKEHQFLLGHHRTS